MLCCVVCVLWVMGSLSNFFFFFQFGGGLFRNCNSERDRERKMNEL